MPRHLIAREADYPSVYTSGNWYDISRSGLAKTTLAGVADRLHVATFIPAKDLTIDTWGIEVTTGVASALARIVIYDSDGTNFDPSTLLQSSGDFDCATNGVKSEAKSFTLTAGHIYWVGVHNSSTATLRGINVGALLQISIPSTIGAASNTCYRRNSATFASGAPNPIGSITAVSSVLPVVGLRAA